MNSSFFAKSLLKWYKTHKRELPWRETKDPYKIWLSEIILQQTRVNQGLPYFMKFVEAFPDMHSLAKASEKSVLSLWQGLGYYSRARNMHLSAKKLVKENKGLLPGNYSDLLKVKGIGKYTAAAIASFAYKERTPVVDGNVFRVLSRHFGVDTDISSNTGINEIYELAGKLIPEKEHDLYNQAIMEFGALHCIPANPKCESCPFSKTCFANIHQLQAILPFKSKKIKKTTRYLNYICIRHKDKFLMRERTGNDIWKGLYEMPLVEAKALLAKEELLKGFSQKKIIIERETKFVKHVLSHQTIFARFILIEVSDLMYFNKLLNELNSFSFSRKQMEKLPKSVLISKFLEEYIFI